MLLFALFMKREKEEKKKERSFHATRVLWSGWGRMVCAVSCELAGRMRSV
jgi:hypothetical protein